MSNMIEFSVGDRRASGYLAVPDGGTGPGVVVIQEWWGLVEHIKDVANRLAGAGFVALAPDLYEGDSTTSPDEAGRKMMALDLANAGSAVRGAAEHLMSLDAVSPKKVATVGFCMGGQLALAALTDHPDAVAAAVDFYGIHPHVTLDFGRVKGSVLAHFGNADEFVPKADAEALVESMTAANVDLEAHFYEAGHAFFNDSRPEAFDKASAELAWARTLDFLKAKLGA